MSEENHKNIVSDAIKKSVAGSGALANLKEVSFSAAPSSLSNSMETLRQEAQSAIIAIKQLLDGLNPNIGVSEKLKAALLDLQSALGAGNVSRMVLEAALAEASTAMSGADGNTQSATAQQIETQLWKRIEADNKDIDDDFEKMRKAGIVFGDKLWNRHKELTEYMLEHPRDIKKQKELDAVDDALLLQADAQLAKHPEAKAAHDDAKEKSKDRHEAVDHALNGIGKTVSAYASAFDDEVIVQHVGQKQKPDGKHLG